MKLDQVQMERLWEHVQAGKRSPLRRGLRVALVAAAIAAVLCVSALALSPALREALTNALGDFAPYSQPVENASTVENGIEIKVISAMADSAMVRVYAEVRDLEGDRLSENLDVWGTVDREELEDQKWEGNSYSGGGKCVGYDPETKTALLQFDSWGSVTNDLKNARLVVLSLYPDKDDWSEEIGEDTWYIPLNIEKMEERTVPLTGEVWGAQLRQLVISPLGITVHTGGKQNIRIEQFSVQLSDGSFFYPAFGGMGGDGWTDNPDPLERVCYVFDDPALAGQITGVAFGYWFIPIDGQTAGPGTWLKEKP